MPRNAHLAFSKKIPILFVARNLVIAIENLEIEESLKIYLFIKIKKCYVFFFKSSDAARCAEFYSETIKNC